MLAASVRDENPQPQQAHYQRNSDDSEQGYRALQLPDVLVGSLLQGVKFQAQAQAFFVQRLQQRIGGKGLASQPR